MRLKQMDHTDAGGRRYDIDTLRKVTALAQESQDRHQETLTPAQIEAIGVEVGLNAAFVRDAPTDLRCPEYEHPQRNRKPVMPGISRAGILIAGGYLLLAFAALALDHTAEGNLAGLLSILVTLPTSLVVMPLIDLFHLLPDGKVGFFSSAMLSAFCQAGLLYIITWAVERRGRKQRQRRDQE
jgi:hypothetical protein